MFVYSNADEVELSLNGTSLGRKKVGSEPVDLPVGGNVSGDHHFASRFRLRWDVPYEPGTLRAVAYRDGKVVAEEVSGPPARRRAIVLVRGSLDHRRRRQRSVVRHGACRGQGRRPVSRTRRTRFSFDGRGPGRIAAVDNGDSASLEPFQADHRAAFHGMALVIVRSVKGSAGSVTVTATSDGLASATAAITTK